MSWTLESYVTGGANPRSLSRGDAVMQHETVLFRLALAGEGAFAASDPANWAEPPSLQVSGSDGYGGTTVVDVRPADENILTFYYTFAYAGSKRLRFCGVPGEHTVLLVIDSIDNFAVLDLTRSIEVSADGREASASVRRRAGGGTTPRGSVAPESGPAGARGTDDRGTGDRADDTRGIAGRGVAAASTGASGSALARAGTAATADAIDEALDATFTGSSTESPPPFSPVTDPATRAAIVRREQFFAELGPHVSEGVRAAGASPDFSGRVDELDRMRVAFEGFMDSTTRALDETGGYRDGAAPRTERALTSVERTRGLELVQRAHAYGGALYNDARSEIWRQVYAGDGRTLLDQARTAGVVQFDDSDASAGRAPRVSVLRPGRTAALEAINLDHATPRERNPFGAMEPANLRPTSSTFNQVYLNRWSATSSFPMYDSPIEDFIARHRLTNRMRIADERAGRGRRRRPVRVEVDPEEAEADGADSIAAGVAEIATRAMALYRLRSYHEVAERIRADLDAMRVRSAEVGDIRSLTHATLLARAQDVFGPLPQESDSRLISQYERAFSAWFDISYAGRPGGRAQEYDDAIASRNAENMARVLDSTADERVTLRAIRPWIEERLANRAQLLSSADGFRGLAELIGEVTSEEVNDLAIEFGDWMTLLDNAERLARTLTLYVHVLDEMLERINEGLMVVEQRYRTLDRELSATYAASGGYVD